MHSSAAAVSFLALAGACVTLLVRSIRCGQVRAAIGNGVVVVLLLPMSPTDSSIQIALTENETERRYLLQRARRF